MTGSEHENKADRRDHERERSGGRRAREGKDHQTLPPWASVALDPKWKYAIETATD